MKEESSKQFKIVLLGEGRVGKTSILTRYVKGTYNDKQPPTIQASYLEKQVEVPGDSRNIMLSIWDTAGQERYHALGPIYYRNADGAVIVYDITDGTSFNRVKTWVKELRKVIGGEDSITIYIVGNKIDLQSKKQVDNAEVLQYAKSIGATHFLTSAKTNEGIDCMFRDVAKKVLFMHKSQQIKKNILVGDFDVNGNQNNIILKESGEEPQSSSCC